MITGAIESPTITILDEVAIFPAESLAEYDTEYVPVADVLTLFEVVEATIAPSIRSKAVAPASV